MSRQTRCRRCGALVAPERFAALLPIWRLCPRCRGPQMPTGAVAASDGNAVLLRPSEAAP